MEIKSEAQEQIKQRINHLEKDVLGEKFIAEKKEDLDITFTIVPEKRRTSEIDRSKRFIILDIEKKVNGTYWALNNLCSLPDSIKLKDIPYRKQLTTIQYNTVKKIKDYQPKLIEESQK